MNPLRKSADEANATGDRMVSVEIDESEEDILKNIKTPLPASVRYIIACVKAMLGCETPSTIDLKLWAMKARVILYRSFLSLFYRYELILATCFVSAMLAVILGWIMGDSSGITSTYNVLALNALGIMLILFGSVQYIFYLNSVQQVIFVRHRNRRRQNLIFFNLFLQVFMKEHARGLYSNFLNWLLSSTPLYILRFCNAVIYSTIVYGMINLDTVAGRHAFYFYNLYTVFSINLYLTR